MVYNKVFFHMGTPCQNCGGVGDMWKALDAGGIPFGVYSVENGGLIVEAARLPRADPIIYRTLATDVAPYHLSPQGAAAQQWALLMEKLPPEVKAIKGRVWVEIGNEQDKTRADWLGNYYSELAAIALPQGYRICGPAWSTGEPEPPDWETSGWLRYLRLCAANPSRLAVTVHEYGLDANDIRAGSPYLAGRVRFLFDACDKHGISRPAVFVTEAGWVHNDMPEPDAAKNDIAWLSALYAGYPTVKAAFLWTLMGGGDKKELGATLNSIVPWLTEWTLRQRWPDPPPPPQPEENMLIDLSKWNGTLNAAKMKAAGAKGVILRAAAGAVRDTMVDTYAPALKAAGIPIVGCYLYYHPYEPWRPQLDALKAVMAKHGIRRGYLDLEDTKTVATLARDAETFMAALTAEMPLPAGKRHGIYSNVSYWRQMGAPAWGAAYDLWVAAWTDVASPVVPAPWLRWTLWQYSNSGNGPAYGLQSARVDLNRFNGTAAAFSEWLSIVDVVDVPAAIRGAAAKQPGAGWHPTHAIPMAIIRDGYLPVGPEFDVTAGGVAYRALRAYDRTGKWWIYYAPVPRWNEVTRIAL